MAPTTSANISSVDCHEVLFLSFSYRSFLDKMYSSLIDELDKACRLKRAKTANGAFRYLEANTPKAVLVTDEGLTDK